VCHGLLPSTRIPPHPVLVENRGLRDHLKPTPAVQLPAMSKDGCRAAISIPEILLLAQGGDLWLRSPLLFSC